MLMRLLNLVEIPVNLPVVVGSELDFPFTVVGAAFAISLTNWGRHLLDSCAECANNVIICLLYHVIDDKFKLGMTIGDMSFRESFIRVFGCFTQLRLIRITWFQVTLNFVYEGGSISLIGLVSQAMLMVIIMLLDSSLGHIFIIALPILVMILLTYFIYQYS
ncbi:hypothetical protein R6Q59_028762 [Mikania micrantha]